MCGCFQREINSLWDENGGQSGCRAFQIWEAPPRSFLGTPRRFHHKSWSQSQVLKKNLEYGFSNQISHTNLEIVRRSKLVSKLTYVSFVLFDIQKTIINGRHGTEIFLNRNDSRSETEWSHICSINGIPGKCFYLLQRQQKNYQAFQTTKFLPSYWELARISSLRNRLALSGAPTTFWKSTAILVQRVMIFKTWAISSINSTLLSSG